MSWVLVTGRTRCGECGSLVARAWRFYKTPTLAVRSCCEPCIERLKKERKIPA